MENENLKPVQTIPPFTKMIMTIGALPTSFYSSMSYYEAMVWLYEYLKNQVIPAVNNNGEAVEELQTAFITLKTWIDEYFDNLDVQEEINKKLDEMAEDGTMTNLIKGYIDPLYQAYEREINESIGEQNAEIRNFKTSVNTQINIIDNKVDSAVSGSPKGVYATVSDLTTADPSHDYIYVVTADGNWYYYDTTETDWVSGGVYQSTGIDENDPVIEKINNKIDKLDDKLVVLDSLEPYQFGVILATGIVYNESYVRTNALKFNEDTEILIYGNSPRVGTFSDENLTTIVNMDNNFSSNEYYKILLNKDYYYCFSFENQEATKEDNGKIYKIIDDTSNKELFDSLNEGIKIDNLRYVNGLITSNGSFNIPASYGLISQFYKFDLDYNIEFNIDSGLGLRIGIYSTPNVSSFVERKIITDKFQVENDKYYVFEISSTNTATVLNPATEYAEFIKIYLNKNLTNPLSNKKIYSFGDSLMYGHYSEVGMIDSIAEENNMNYTKYAINGGFILGGSGSYNIENQVTSASDTVPDFIIFDGLMNDDSIASSYTTNLGSLSNDFDASLLNTSTFYGAMEHLIYTLKNKYMTSNIIFVCCHKTPSRNYQAQQILQEAVRKCCEKWSIPYVDIFNEGQINCYMDNMKYAYSYNNEGETHGGNGTHLTGEGYKKWYAPQITEMMLKLTEKE